MSDKLRRYSNTAVNTTLSGAITASSTSLQIPDATGWPSPPFTLAIDNEIIMVGDRTVAGPLTTFSDLTRGYDNTIAVDHGAGTAIEHKAIAGDFSYRWQDVLTTPTWHTLDDEFDDASRDSDWTEVAPTGSATWMEARGILSCRFTEQSPNDITGLVRNIGALIPPVYITTAVRLLGTHEVYGMAGLVFSDGATTTSNALAAWAQIDTSTWTFSTSAYGGTFTNMATQIITPQLLHSVPWLFIRVDWANANEWRVWFSPDGVSWDDFDQGTISRSLTPTHAGMMVSTWDTTIVGNRIATFEHFRVYETKPNWWVDS